LSEADSRGLNRDDCGGANAKLRSSKKFPCHDSSQGFESNTAFGLLYHVAQDSQTADALTAARRICLLGFSYHPMNLQRLTLKDSALHRIVFGTAFGLIGEEMNDVSG
jgi:hypothetical protein